MCCNRTYVSQPMNSPVNETADNIACMLRMAAPGKMSALADGDGMCPGVCNVGASQSGTLSGGSGLRAQDRETAQAAAVAAAALAVNNGNPAAALLDLLNLAMRKSTQADQNGLY